MVKPLIFLIFTIRNSQDMDELQFSQEGNRYSCGLSSSQNKGIIQIETNGSVSVSANLTGMDPSVVGIFDNPYGNSVIFAVDFPDGVEVKLSTTNQPTKALWKESE